MQADAPQIAAPGPLGAERNTSLQANGSITSHTTSPLSSALAPDSSSEPPAPSPMLNDSPVPASGVLDSYQGTKQFLLQLLTASVETGHAGGLRGWSNTTELCNWTHVSCRGSSVAVDLSGLGLIGTLPEASVAATSLVALNLSHNRFDSSLPASWAALLPSLQSLDLSQNAITGVLPREWSGATGFLNLSELHLNRMNLSGGLPESWNQPLQTLSLSDNELEGTLPGSWSTSTSLAALRVLRLASNRLTGSLPAAWGTGCSGLVAMQDLKELDVAFNQLTGSIPSYKWQNLQRFYLNNNTLCGALPPNLLNKLYVRSALTWMNDTQLTRTDLLLPSSDPPAFASCPNTTAQAANISCPAYAVSPNSGQVASSSGGSSTNVGAIAGGVVGGVVGAVLIILLAVFLTRRRAHPDPSQNKASAMLLAEANSRSSGQSAEQEQHEKFEHVRDWLGGSATPRAGEVLDTGGSAGPVNKAVLDNNTNVAVKYMADFGVPEEQMHKFSGAMSRTCRCRHRHVVQLLGAWLGEDISYLVMEHVQGSSLADLFDGPAEDTQTLKWYNRGKDVAIQMIKGLRYLHHRKVKHGSLKASNVLIDSGGTVKISGAGLPRPPANLDPAQEAGLPSLASYLAPEAISGANKVTTKADVFAAGAVMWQLITGEPQPADGVRRRPLVPEECPEYILALIDRCLAPMPEDRPNIQEVLVVLQLPEG
ncbi:hypothetical protein WJX73_004529 [Symbiochloris irregularis]|uniref:Protein kinase domain-containing protein n=1 Tax=Symbiochloris irregularis TaxID=706552 RepID=A0AAW1PUU9_9CHLO